MDPSDVAQSRVREAVQKHSPSSSPDTPVLQACPQKADAPFNERIGRSVCWTVAKPSARRTRPQPI